VSESTCHGCQEILARLDALERNLLPRITTPGNSAPEYVDAGGVAERYGVTRTWVYRNADKLGGWKLGDGPRGRWRFEAATVDMALRGPAPTPQPAKPRKRAPTSSKTLLLPIRGGSR
jgi:hypothetical protein